jgi:hypothetical protein
MESRNSPYAFDLALLITEERSNLFGFRAAIIHKDMSTQIAIGLVSPES